MNGDFNWYMPVRLISGEGCLKEGGDTLRMLGRRCLVVTSQHAAAACGALDDALAALSSAKIDYTVFPGIGPNPLVTQCQAAAFAAEACRADFLLGIGGGSVMDATKAAAWLAANNITDANKLFTGLRHPALPVALVGTTAGTGSEVTATAVLTTDIDGRKKSINHPQCFARVVFADPRYTYTVGIETTISTALDALSHSVEGWLSPSCGEMASACAEKAIPVIMNGLRQMVSSPAQLPDKETRDRLYFGSLWAGMVLNSCGTAFPHPFGYILTEDFAVDHGMACAVFLPSLIERAEVVTPLRTQSLYTLCGGKDQLLHTLEELTQTTRQRIHMTEAQIIKYAERWPALKDKNFARVPGGFTPEEGMTLFSRLFMQG